MSMTDQDTNETERVETPADPFNRLVLNPASETEASGNPLCPDCESPIRPFANQHQRVFKCDCERVKQFSFDRSADSETAQGGKADE